MTAIEELHRMLDERGAEYRVSATGYSIDIGPYTTAYANRSDTTLDVSLRQVTPEQAIAATLGAGTCHVESSIIDTYEYNRWEYELSCGHAIIWEDSEPPNYCPNCGRRIEQ